MPRPIDCPEVQAERRAHDNQLTARWWLGLSDLETKINNDLLPLAGHLGLGDAALHEAMRQLAREIARFQGAVTVTIAPVEDRQ